MAMNVGGDSGDEPSVMATINTTPLVDVMLVLLIIFLITIPVITQHVKVKLPHANNTPTVTKPHEITISVTRNGSTYWGTELVSSGRLLQKIMQVAVEVPQPAVKIRGDRNADYRYIGHVLYELQRGGMVKVDFISEPTANDIGVH
ncbi:biopolymer transport protein ExbD/TolR [mine drainage metagenome]|jgi:biopolymer transport protein ExbD|uniref:Biopolymer transport protein ExbD/TolR n=1 Tax=mine drainage metagenome TaxID=410659 RepID=T0YDN3_9ZZZZ